MFLEMKKCRLLNFGLPAVLFKQPASFKNNTIYLAVPSQNTLYFTLGKQVLTG